MFLKLSTVLILLFCIVENHASTSLDSIKGVFEKVDSLQKLKIIEEIPYEVFVSNVAVSEELFKEGIAISSQLNKNVSKAEILSKLAIVHQLHGDYNLSIEKNLEAIKLFESEGLMKNVAVVYGSMGFSIKGYDLDLAIEYMRKAISIAEKENGEDGLSGVYNNYGVLKKLNKELDSALYFYNKSLELVRLHKDSIGIPYSLHNIGEVKMYQRKFEEAEGLFQEAYSIRLLTNDAYGMVDSELYFGDLYFEQSDFTKAIRYYQKALAKSEKGGYLHLKKYALERLSVCYEKNADFTKAYAYRLEFDRIKDSLLNESKNNEISRLQMLFETEKKDKDLAEKKATLVRKDAELEKQELINEEERKRKYYLYGGIGILSVLGLVLFNRFTVTRRQNGVIQLKNKEVEEQRKIAEFQKELVEEKNKEVMDSILYAERIQMALLKSDSLLSENIPEHFILFKPKDIVSGDFFWILEKEKSLYVAVGDCTGHGVPGAFLTMLGTSFLNEINAHEEMVSPASILDVLRSKIIRELSQSGEEGDSKDGMDISIVKIDLGTQSIEWAGANNPVYIVSNGEIREIKADKQPIGYYAQMTPYTNHSVQLKKEDLIYLFTDGFPDQFGGPRGKKYKYKPFKHKLLSNSGLPMDQQRMLLDTEFETWKGELEQIDDVCVFGIRL